MEYLTQKAIDSFLSGKPALEEVSAQIEMRPYSFRRPPRISKDRLLVLDAVLSRFAQGLQAVLSFRLHAPLKVSIVTIEQVIYTEFLLSLASPCAAFEFRLRPGSQERGVVDLGTSLSLYCVDRMLGGPGEPLPADRRLTRLEQGIAHKVAGYVVSKLADGLAEWSKLSPEIVSFEANPEALTGMHPEEHILAVIFEVRSEEFAGQISIGLPLATLEEVTGLSGGSSAGEPEGDAVASKEQLQLERGLRQTQVEVAIRLPIVNLGTKAVAALQVGDVIDSGYRGDVLFEVHLNGKPAFVGALGQIQRRLGLKIEERLNAAQSGRWVLGKEGRVL